jgi:hypothetical protein
MANEKPEIKHAFDVWHVAKGMYLCIIIEELGPMLTA